LGQFGWSCEIIIIEIGIIKEEILPVGLGGGGELIVIENALDAALARGIRVEGISVRNGEKFNGTSWQF
jgi:hypothetical protein